MKTIQYPIFYTVFLIPSSKILAVCLWKSQKTLAWSLGNRFLQIKNKIHRKCFHCCSREERSKQKSIQISWDSPLCEIMVCFTYLIYLGHDLDTIWGTDFKIVRSLHTYRLDYFGMQWWKVNHKKGYIWCVLWDLGPIYTVRLCRMRQAYDRSTTWIYGFVKIKPTPRLRLSCTSQKIS